MSRSRSMIVALGLVALGGVFAFARARAQGKPFVRDFAGEADEEVTSVIPVPDGMVCGGLSVGSGLTVQTSEPAGGFTGACLMNRPYGASLPSVCFSPTNGSYANYGKQEGSVKCTVPASNVNQPEWSVRSDQEAGAVTRQYAKNSYRVLETCAPHLGHPDPLCPLYEHSIGDCPCNTVPVSHSCCTHYETKMTSGDGQTATGTAYFATQSASSDASSGSD